MILFNRAAGFLVRLPNTDAKPRVVKWPKKRTDDDLDIDFGDVDDGDVPF